MRRVELVYDRDCPNVEAARTNLQAALVKVGAEPRWAEWDVASPDSPDRVKRFGSPTVLVDGRDVAGDDDRQTGASCRLYENHAGAPSVEQLVAALAGAGSGRLSGWKSSLAAVPGIGLASLPPLACPACWPAYAGLLSSLGLGFLVETKYLLPLTAVALAIALGSLAYQAPSRRGYGPLILGSIGAAGILVGKFWFDSTAALYGGVGLLVIATVWNALGVPRRRRACGACLSGDLDDPQSETLI